ncbi:MAG: hypothetical protein KAI24_03465 [Planctomycetes bacterium]|nr:hypothetical protein [Planctomycetota bacterium]
MSAPDRQVVDGWWRSFVATGRPPDELAHVQGRLIRAVHQGALPSGPVHVKTMTFPRAKDRLRYAFRALPAAHEAAMLRATAAAGIPCPEVVAVRSGRRLGLPHRSMLVLRSLSLRAGDEDQVAEAADEVELAMRLLRAGIWHRDLHTDNFVRLATGELAVLDMQSASRIRPSAHPSSSARLAVAARLLRERAGDARDAALSRMRECGMLAGDAECAAAVARSDAERRRFERSRIRRCLTNSTEFERRVRWNGMLYAVRGPTVDGRWWRGPRALQQAWLGQRARQLQTGAPLVFAAFFRKWWWLGGGAALYVPRACSDDRIEAEVRTASAAVRAPMGRSAVRSGRSG